jgi:hypothetical protein
MNRFTILGIGIALLVLHMVVASAHGQTDRRILIDEFKRKVGQAEKEVPRTENSVFRRQAEKLQAETQRLKNRGTALILDSDAHLEQLKSLKKEALAIKKEDIGAVAKLRGIMRRLDDLSRRMDENRLQMRKLNDDFQIHLDNLRDLSRRIRAAQTKK